MCLKIIKYNILFLDYIIVLFGYNEKKGVYCMYWYFEKCI